MLYGRPPLAVHSVYSRVCVSVPALWLCLPYHVSPLVWKSWNLFLFCKFCCPFHARTQDQEKKGICPNLLDKRDQISSLLLPPGDSSQGHLRHLHGLAPRQLRASWAWLRGNVSNVRCRHSEAACETNYGTSKVMNYSHRRRRQLEPFAWPSNEFFQETALKSSDELGIWAKFWGPFPGAEKREKPSIPAWRSECIPEAGVGRRLGQVSTGCGTSHPPLPASPPTTQPRKREGMRKEGGVVDEGMRLPEWMWEGTGREGMNGKCVGEERVPANR